MARRQLSLLKTVCKSCLGLAGTLAVGTSMTAVLASAAAAQEPRPVLDRLEDIMENRSGDYFRSRSFKGQVGFITGLGGFPENRISRDAESISGAYDELMILQTQNTPTLRVPDLPNPYTTSVQLLPVSQFDSRVVGSELNFEPLPRR
ncbi:hypothetical protein [cf. Phormidesmis sp. LEGE 11477]|uniref:hypothetical protein n=1 Tax=cf. Phormidesmis sp. LEGE 11477 TaxID=1828680 RepID=UPI00187F3B43|nr:hypothetical protein [cf. Phormidesmis sp. LEGE 11477]MBE9064178.1 hypothetical protein [cf. Phormidesmis sp. LEGE 11477]